MERMHCDIVKDLLPLYVDDVCSEKSRMVIEEHLKECEECKKCYEQLIDKTPEVVMDEGISYFEESEFIQKIKKKITFDRVVVGFVVFLVLAMGSTVLLPYPHQPGFGLCGLVDQRAEKENLVIRNLYQLENGKIYFEVISSDSITWPHIDTPIYNAVDNYWYGMAHYEIEWKEQYFGGKGNGKSFWFLFSPYEEDELGNSEWLSEFIFECKEDEKIVVWKRGQQIEKAPEEIEERVLNTDGAVWSSYCARLDE